MVDYKKIAVDQMRSLYEKCRGNEYIPAVGLRNASRAMASLYAAAPSEDGKKIIAQQITLLGDRAKDDRHSSANSATFIAQAIAELITC